MFGLQPAKLRPLAGVALMAIDIERLFGRSFDQRPRMERRDRAFGEDSVMAYRRALSEAGPKPTGDAIWGTSPLALVPPANRQRSISYRPRAALWAMSRQIPGCRCSGRIWETRDNYWKCPRSTSPLGAPAPKRDARFDQRR